MRRMSKHSLTANDADKASRGEDVSGHFTNQFTVVRPVRRVKPSSRDQDFARTGAELRTDGSRKVAEVG
jgi:hypothetical protein